MQKQMIVTVPEEILSNNGDSERLREGIFEACSSFLKGETSVILVPDTFSYEIKDVSADISEVVLTIDKGV